MGISVFPVESSSSSSSVVLGQPVNIIPSGISLRHTYTTTQAVSIPTTPVFVFLVGGGGGGGIRPGDNVGGGGSGGIVMGWCDAPTSVTVGAGGVGGINGIQGGGGGGETYVNTFPISANGGGGGPYQNSGGGTRGSIKNGIVGQSYDLITSLRNGNPGSVGGQAGEDVGYCSGGGGSSGSNGAKGGDCSVFSKTGGAASGSLGGGGAGVVANGSVGSNQTGGAGGTGGGGGGASSAGSAVGGAGGTGAVLVYY